jgi:hypothetical protein
MINSKNQNKGATSGHIFHGGLDEDVSTFLARIAIRAEVCGWTTEEHYRELLCALDGEALLYIHGIPKAQRGTVATVERLLKTRYGGHMSMEEIILAASRLVMEESETIPAFANRFDELKGKCPEISDAYLATNFARGINDKRVKAFVLDQGPMTLKEARDLAMRKHRNLQEVGEVDSKVDEVEELTRKIASLSLVIEGMKKGEGTLNPGYRGHQGTPPGGPGAGTGHFRCYRCGGDHLQRVCPTLTCHRCGQNGHMMAMCPQGRGEGQMQTAKAHESSGKGEEQRL